MADAIPIVSQAKSLVQWLGGDSEGAERTQQNFSKQCIGVSQIRSAVEAICGDEEAARETQKEFLRGVSSFADATPVVGHVKGVIHYACGDRNGGDNAMKAASRTTGAVLGGAGGFLVGGPPGAAAGGAAGAAAVDVMTTAIDSGIHGNFKPAGIIQQVSDNIEDPHDAGKWFDTAFTLVGDGVTGYASVKAAVRGKQGVVKRTIRRQFEDKRHPLVNKVGKQGAKDLVKAADHMDRVRKEYKIPEKKAHVTCVVTDEVSNVYVGHNKNVRKFCRMSEFDLKSPTHLEIKVPDAKPPLKRSARTCAEHRAYEKYYDVHKDVPPEKTRVAAVRYDKVAQDIKAVERCDNCKAYSKGMGKAPGDHANGITVPIHPGIGKFSYLKDGAQATGWAAAGLACKKSFKEKNDDHYDGDSDEDRDDYNDEEKDEEHDNAYNNDEKDEEDEEEGYDKEGDEVDDYYYHQENDEEEDGEFVEYEEEDEDNETDDEVPNEVDNDDYFEEERDAVVDQHYFERKNEDDEDDDDENSEDDDFYYEEEDEIDDDDAYNYSDEKDEEAENQDFGKEIGAVDDYYYHQENEEDDDYVKEDWEEDNETYDEEANQVDSDGDYCEERDEIVDKYDYEENDDDDDDNNEEEDDDDDDDNNEEDDDDDDDNNEEDDDDDDDDDENNGDDFYNGEKDGNVDDDYNGAESDEEDDEVDYDYERDEVDDNYYPHEKDDGEDDEYDGCYIDDD